MMDAPARPVVNIHGDLETFEFGHGDAFHAMHARLGPLIGSRQLGAMLTRVEPGKKAFPFHAHHANEEMFLVLEGAGQYRFGSDHHDIGAGDLMAAPAGGQETAHHIINTGDKTLVYLSISTMHDPEVVEYPDSGKFSVMSRVDWSAPDGGAGVRFIGRKASSLDYFDGEDG